MKLIKVSLPGWMIEVASEEDAAKKLWPHICGLCRKPTYWDDDNPESGLICEPAIEYNLSSMLNSPCGCEYEYHE